MNRPPPDEEQHNRIVAVTLDEESIGRSGPDIEHERAIAIYDLIEQNLFAPEVDAQGPFTLHLAITGNRLMFDIRREDGTPVVGAPAVADAVPANREGLFHDLRQLLPGRSAPRRRTRSRRSTWAAAASMTKARGRCRNG